MYIELKKIMWGIIKYILLVCIIFAAIYYIQTKNDTKIKYYYGNPDTVRVEGKKDTIKIDKYIYVNKIIYPQKDTTTAIIDTTITNGNSSIDLYISCSPVPDSIIYSITWHNKEIEIHKVDTIYITRVDTLLTSNDSFYKGVITATGIISAVYLIYTIIGK